MECAFVRTFDFSNHTMRRTFGRRQWQLKTPVETISDMFGHESIDMTKKYLSLNLTDHEEPIKAQLRFVRSVV
jgi:integrase